MGASALALVWPAFATSTPAIAQPATPPTAFKISSIDVGSAPGALAIDSATHTVYVAMPDATGVFIIDETSRKTIGELPLSGTADHIAIDPATHYVYVAMQENALQLPGITIPVLGHDVKVFDGTTHEEVWEADFGGPGQNSLAIDSVGHRVFLAAGGAGNVFAYVEVLDTVTHRPDFVESNVRNASGIVFDGSTKRVYVVKNTPAGTVDMLNTGVGFTTPVTAKVGASPTGIAFDPTSGRLYVPNQGSHSVSVLAAATNTVIKTIALGTSPSSVAVDPASHVVYVGDDIDNTVTVIDGNTLALINRVPVGPNPDSIAVDSSNHTVWISTRANNAITVLSPVVTRFSGPDRFTTAIAVSAAAYSDDTADAVVLARSDSYPDALVGAPLAAAKNGPLLFASGATLPPATQAEIQRVLAPGKVVYLLGGVAAIPETVASQLVSLGYQAVRFSGANRFATATAVADGLGDPSTVLLASGSAFPDALAAGPAASKVHGAVLLTAGSVLPPETAAYLTAHPGGTVYAIGGPAAQAAPTAVPLVGADRYATAVSVAKQFFASPTVAGVASGTAFPDALTAGAYLSRIGSPLLLSTSTALPTATSAYLTANATSVVMFGGPAAVSAGNFGGAVAVSAAVQAAAGAPLP